MDKEGVEALQRDEVEYEEQKGSDLTQQRNGYLNKSDWMVLRHTDQTSLSIKTAMTKDEFKGLLTWRQALRDMPEMMSDKSISIVWPEFPDYLKDEFPDYPVRMKTAH
jgi:hypothetical protein